jgi:hypothetical protein
VAPLCFRAGPLGHAVWEHRANMSAQNVVDLVTNVVCVVPVKLLACVGSR